MVNPTIPIFVGQLSPSPPSGICAVNRWNITDSEGLILRIERSPRETSHRQRSRLDDHRDLIVIGIRETAKGAIVATEKPSIPDPVGDQERIS